MTKSANVRPDRIIEIAGLLSIADEAAMSDVDIFWGAVAAALSIEPRDGHIDTARAIIDHVAEWEDEYVSDDGETLSDAAYREVLSVLNERTNYGTSPLALRDDRDDHDVDDADDEDGAEWTRFALGVGQHTQPDARTLLGMMFAKEIIVNPEWQRNFVWPLKKQRRFIESILMGLPIPSLLLYENPETRDRFVIDGRQRLETLARFCATADQREELGFLGRRFKTFSTKESGWKPGEDLHGGADKFFEQLPTPMQRKLSSTPFTIFTFNQLKPRQLYQIFQRYNTGAEKLRAAEIRNAVYQASDLHHVLWQLAGESPDTLPPEEGDEEYYCQTLRNIMRTKVARYGTYDFIGRVLAFTHLDNGKTVAAATNDFMDQFEERDHEQIRLGYLRSLEKVLDWYRYPLTTPEDDGRFHAFLGTIQLATAHHVLQEIDEGRLVESQVRDAIASHWSTYADETLELKQNSGTFWDRQRAWKKMLLGEQPVIQVSADS